MPAIAVVAAMGTISAGAAMGGVLGGIMIAGGVMSAAGAVTGNKELSKWGAVASLGAGIGSAMGLAGSANSMWNSAVGADSALSVTGKSFLDSGGSLSGIGDALGRNAGQTAIADSAGNAATAGTPAAPAASPSQAVAPNPVQSPVPAEPSPFSQLEKLPAAGPDLKPVGLIDKYVSGASQLPPVGSSYTEQALAFMRTNPEVTKAGMGLMQGGLMSYSQQRQQEAMIEAENARRARYNQSITNQRPMFRG